MAFDKKSNVVMAVRRDVVMATRRGLVYEGSGNFLRAIHPVPIVSLAKFEDYKTSDGMVFREDSFDPATRIRRGRFYAKCDDQIRTISVENVHNHPFGKHIGIAEAEGSTWNPDCLYQPFEPENDTHQNLHVCVIGDHKFQTTWRVVEIERIFTGELLWTLVRC
jgi:hypothetical protein